jgi:hypothetical protein
MSKLLKKSNQVGAVFSNKKISTTLSGNKQNRDYSFFAKAQPTSKGISKVKKKMVKTRANHFEKHTSDLEIDPGTQSIYYISEK